MKFFTAMILALPAFAIAHPSLKSRQDGNGTCTTGAPQCCEQTYDPASATGYALYRLASNSSGAGPGHAGVGCTNLVLGGNCDLSPVCCTETSPALVSLGCIPITL